MFLSLIVKQGLLQSPPVLPENSNTGMCCQTLLSGKRGAAMFMPLPQRSSQSRSRTPILCFLPGQHAQVSSGSCTGASLCCGRSQERSARHQLTTEPLSSKNTPVRAPTITWSSKLQRISRYPKETSTLCSVQEQETACRCHVAQAQEVSVGRGD